MDVLGPELFDTTVACDLPSYEAQVTNITLSHPSACLHTLCYGISVGQFGEPCDPTEYVRCVLAIEAVCSESI